MIQLTCGHWILNKIQDYFIVSDASKKETGSSLKGNSSMTINMITLEPIVLEKSA
jgi:hypothetical protein